MVFSFPPPRLVSVSLCLLVYLLALASVSSVSVSAQTINDRPEDFNNNNGWGWQQTMGPRSPSGQAASDLERMRLVDIKKRQQAYLASYQAPQQIVADAAEANKRNAELASKRDSRGFWPAGARPKGCTSIWGNCSTQSKLDPNQSCEEMRETPGAFQICYRYIVPEVKYVAAAAAAAAKPAASPAPSPAKPVSMPVPAPSRASATNSKPAASPAQAAAPGSRAVSPANAAQIKALQTPDTEYVPPKYPAGTRPDGVEILRNTDCASLTLKPFQKAFQNPGRVCATSYHYTEPDHAGIAALQGGAPEVAIACPLSFMEISAESVEAAMLQMNDAAAPKSSTKRAKSLSKAGAGAKKVAPRLRSGLTPSQKKQCEAQRAAYLKAKKGKQTKSAGAKSAKRAVKAKVAAKPRKN